MTRRVPLARPDFTLESVASAIMDAACNAVVIVDELCRPVGIVTRTDVLRALSARGDDELRAPIRGLSDALEYDGMHLTMPLGATARDVMAPLVLTLPENATVAEASATLAQLGLQQLVITGPDRVVAGIVTALDVTRWIAWADGPFAPD